MAFKGWNHMPLPGGATDKFGNRYEGLWTVACMVEVLEERADSIRLEPPGNEGKGVEFRLHRGDKTEYHQVKRQYNKSGRWTLAELEEAPRHVLSHFFDKIGDPHVCCVFVSTQAAYQLDELSDRARRSACFEEFEQEFIKDTKNIKSFENLCDIWNTRDNKINAYESLKRINVMTISEDLLRNNVEDRLTTLVDENPANIRDVLAHFALDEVHHELIASDIWDHLKERGYHPRQWGKDPHVLSKVKAQSDRYLSRLHDEIIAGKIIPREEIKMIFDTINSQDGTRRFLISGEAGVGKSNVIYQVVEMLRGQSWPILAFRVDRLDPTQRPEDVGSQLGLPGSPANVLAAISQGCDCVLVIDQLDAISLASGRNPDFFDCIQEIINQTQAYPKMRLLLACRKFDIDNDHRLRRITDKQGTIYVMKINRLPHEIVKRVVDDFGLDARRLNTKQLDLLSIPLHLRLLSEIPENTTIGTLDFETARDLYREYWSYKQAVLRERLGQPVQWVRVIDALCDHMSERLVLYAPEEVVDECEYDAKAMASEHVLILDNKKYAFFHEGFFDYAFARLFAARKQDILSLLQSDEQHLFRRAQVRQILLHEREIDPERYFEHLDALLINPDIRFHLKKVVFSLLAELADPYEEEWNIIATFIDDQENPSSKEVWRILNGSVPWFELLDSIGLVEKWLSNPNEKYFVRARDLLIGIQDKRPDRVADLIDPYVSLSGEWKNCLVHFMDFPGAFSGYKLFKTFMKLIDEGTLDEVTWHHRPQDLSSVESLVIINSDLPKTHPDWACEFIGHYLNWCLRLSIKNGKFNPFESGAVLNVGFYNQIIDNFIHESAEGDPNEFIAQVLPFMLKVIGFTSKKSGGPPYPDSVWEFHRKGESTGTKWAILNAMETALSNIAVNNPEYFEHIAEQLEDLDFKTVQYLLIRAYAANGERFSEGAIDYLYNQPSRLKTGYLENPHWATRELLEAITPYCSNKQLSRLEKIILDYYSDGEKSPNGRYHRGYSQLVLLDGIKPTRHSKVVSERLETLRQKFGKKPLDPKYMTIRSGFVKSPIKEDHAENMTNEQWLEAVTRYNNDHKDETFEIQDPFIGGAYELSNVLEKQVEKDPTRFAELATNFSDGVNNHYFNAILRGIANTDSDVETVLKICQYCHQLPNHPCGRWICQLIANLAEQALPDEALEIVAWYATKDPDPEEELWRTNAPGGDLYYDGDIINAGINSVRGNAAEAMGKLILPDKDRIVCFKPELEQMVQDPSIAVRSWVARTLTAVLIHDEDLAVQLFLQLCETEDKLLGTINVEYCIKYALQTHFDSLKQIIERMIKSEVSETIKCGARQVCAASLDLEKAKPLADLCLRGTEIQRLSSAEVFALNLREYRPLCEDKLIQLFNDSSEIVSVEAATCFNAFEDDELSEYVDLIEAFVKSTAFNITQSPLINALEKTTAKLPEITCQICERYLDAIDSHNPYERSASLEIKVSQLILRIYRQTKDETLRTKCLDLIDRIMQIESYGLERGLSEGLSRYDR